MANNEEETRSSSFNFSEGLVSRVDIAEVTDLNDYESLTTSGVLSHCKRKILRPYLRLLAVMGLRSIGTDQPNTSKTILVLGYLHLVQVILLMIIGYVLQYMTCLRRDWGFWYKADAKEFSNHTGICLGNPVYSYIIPSVLHFSGYLYTLYLFRVKESEQLENLMERTFLLSSHRTDGPKKQQVLIRNLWIFIIFGILWILSSFSSVIIMLHRLEVITQWIYSDKYEKALKIILTISTLWHDMVQATIITSYCLQAQLLSSSLHFLRAKLLQHTIPPLTWIREINEYQNFLNYLNNKFAPAVCLFILLDISWAASGSVWLSRYNPTEGDNRPIQIHNVLITVLWTLAAIVPFIMASVLTSACSMLRSLGHEVRTRPFVYQDTPAEDLNTILLYTSTMKMKCKLFRMPVSGRYLIFSLNLCVILILILGQCQILK